MTFERSKRVKICGRESLDKEGHIISFIAQAASMTHYPPLDRRRIDLPYRTKAKDVLSLWYEFIRVKKGERKTVEGKVGETVNAFQQYLFPDLFHAPFPALTNPEFTFINFFAGIGGFRMAFQKHGGRMCIPTISRL